MTQDFPQYGLVENNKAGKATSREIEGQNEAIYLSPNHYIPGRGGKALKSVVKDKVSS
jgi:hypothetical protein